MSETTNEKAKIYRDHAAAASAKAARLRHEADEADKEAKELLAFADLVERQSAS